MLKMLRATVVVNAMMLAFAMFLGSGGAYAAGGSCLPSGLKQRLAEINRKFGPVRVISAHRPGATVAGSGQRSYHASCRAVDFQPTRNHAAIVAYLKANHGGGVGTYSCGMSHIHIDNGPRIRFHKCVSANGAPISRSRHASRGGRSKAQTARARSNTRYASQYGYVSQGL